MNDEDNLQVVNEQWNDAREVLLELLRQHGGSVGTKTVRKRLEAKGIGNTSEVITKLKFHYEEGIEAPFYHHGRSFYVPDEYQKIHEDTESAAAKAEAGTDQVGEEDTTTPTQYRREEARLVQYVHTALADLYATDYGPESEYVFDVHSARPGNEFENVDLVAVHWRSDEVAELVSVEVKLGFTAKLAQQANNYRRFSDRVWIALPVSGQLSDAALELRELDALLFEHVIQQGMGILACRRTRGSAYEIMPIHWPTKCHVDTVERSEFLERYRSVFEEASVLEPRHKRRFPRVR